MKKILTKEINVLPLLTPNFILLDDESKSALPLSDFTEEELRELCAEFTENVIKKSKGEYKK